MPSSDHPCEVATAHSSLVVSDSVTYRHDSPCCRPSIRNSIANVVLPGPGSPWTRYIRSAVRPPRSSSSSPGIPVETIDWVASAGIPGVACNGWAEYFYNRGVMRFPPIVRAGLGVVALAAASTLQISAQQSSYAPPALTAADYARAEKFMGYNTTPLVLDGKSVV